MTDASDKPPIGKETIGQETKPKSPLRPKSARLDSGPLAGASAEASLIEMAFEEVRRENHEAFAAWVRLVEIPLRRSLAGFARQVDVEAVLQEGLMRMWVLAPRLHLRGNDASLRYAMRLVRNLAISWNRKRGGTTLAGISNRHDPPGRNRIQDLPAPPGPDPTPDPVLLAAIRFCIEILKGPPRTALLARIRDLGANPDRDLAARTGMKPNTFLQNIVRARHEIRDCLIRKGIEVEEYLS